MTVAAILRHKGTDIVHVRPNATLYDVSVMLAEYDIGAVLVRDDAGRVLGIVSERDVVRNLAAHDCDALSLSVEEVMTRDVVTATPRTTAVRALEMMTEGRFRHLPVMDGDRLQGLISIGDVVKQRISQQEHEVDSLKAYVSGVC